MRIMLQVDAAEDAGNEGYHLNCGFEREWNMKLHGIHIDERELSDFCQKHSIRELSFFGSIVRNDFHSESDIDVIVDFVAGSKPNLWAFAGIELELSALLGRSAHLHTREMIHPYLKKRIEAASQRIFYAA